MDFARKLKMWLLISLIIALPGLIVMGTKGMNFGIDFTGGSLLEVGFEEEISTGQVREVLGQFGLEDSSIQTSGESRFIIRTQALAEGETGSILEQFEVELGSTELLRNEMVDPIIGEELTRNGIMALAIASILMILYITYRFEFNFAVAAIIAISHDVLVTVAVLSLLQLPITSAFIAAILTVIGYSINDTIVVFDRIRENLKAIKESYVADIVNKSVMQTLTRSINTALSTAIALLALIFLGGETTQVFALTLLIGIISGTYSSIFIASPLWSFMRSRKVDGGYIPAEKT